ncbi:hypothetical protein P280DRAFT_543945 [Massarina eburnea CBS 473.64]|uniref:Cytochrome P450 n=1 Tax=Massarina eburnea CBS 473.64 TaxID=1395130 RepID=A0A6A6S1E9_9PLEO|nr:hypothetical protein P280DRAFT_543945 [Massarina eburnea CBS 473.64]
MASANENPHDEITKEALNEVEEAKNIILFKPDGTAYGDRHTARAQPNQRLVEAFGIDNAFTSIDTDWRRMFIKDTTTKMKAATKIQEKNDESKGDWRDLRSSAIDALKEFLSQPGDKKSLTDMAQFVTLKVSLGFLFDDAAKAMKHPDSFKDIQYIGAKINTIWIESKNESGKRPQWSDEKKLHKALLSVTTLPPVTMPGWWAKNDASNIDPLDPKKNPMNFLLPAYETMWRVVMRCVLEVLYRNNPSDRVQWKSVLSKYFDALKDADAMDKGIFWERSQIGITMIDIVKEALRLYPPSRHIHRIYNDKPYSADIERLHRNALLGSNDPLTFRPDRWLQIGSDLRKQVFNNVPGARKKLKTEEQRLGFMPFAFHCAADNRETRAFGMKMIALLVATLCDGLDGKWTLDKADELPPDGEALCTNREAYGGLLLKKTS